MKKLFFMFVILFSAVLSPFGSASAEENSGKNWVSKADLPEARSAAATAVVDGKIYVIGGFGSKSVATNTTFVYDPKTNEWTQKADIPTQRAGAAVAVVDEKIYVIGGTTTNGARKDNSQKVEIYDPKKDTWETGPDVPIKSYDYLVSAAVVDDTIHLFIEKTGIQLGHFAYNENTKQWEKKNDKINYYKGAAVASVDGKIYIMGGGKIDNFHNLIYEYDSKSDSWNKKGKLKFRTTNIFAAAVVGKKIYLGGGASTLWDVTARVQVYDPATDTVDEIPSLQYERSGASTVAVGNDLYVIGGSSQVNFINRILKSVEMFSLDDANNPDTGTTPGDDNDSSNGENPGNTDDKDQSEEGDALLVITMVNGLQKEYQLSMKEVNAFLKWYKQRDAGEGPGFYEIDEHDNNKGPFESKKDYVVFKNILMFEVNKYKE
ncbi:DUF1668 domain-containing protein [Bacillus swezeyi]|uniref:Kelch repeat-containing protein n=1 Tax=Bacillus swezeyi TaxID=1925020 RepID=UPI002E227CCB|nr:DUF1668 domain-containing protein [Bacillus swezeyi]